MSTSTDPRTADYLEKALEEHSVREGLRADGPIPELTTTIFLLPANQLAQNTVCITTLLTDLQLDREASE